MWFYSQSQDSFPKKFKDLNLGDRNHVELFFKTSLRGIINENSKGKIGPIIKRIGAHVECICSQISKTTFHQRLRSSLLRGPSFILHRPNHILCPTQATSRPLLLKPRKVISKRNRALAARSFKYLYGRQACCRCPNYVGSTYSPGLTLGFDLGSSLLAHPFVNDDSDFNLDSL
jgi:hypothetical protein